MSKILLDANILLRLILQDDEQLFKRAITIVSQAKPSSLIVSPVIAAEVVYVLRIEDYSRAQAAENLLLLIKRPQFKQSELLYDSLNFFSETRLDFADCYLLARALSSGEKLKTLDVELQKAYNRLKKPS